MSYDPPPTPPTRARLPAPSFFFRPSWVAAVCWIVASSAYIAVVGIGGRKPVGATGFALTLLAMGLPVGVFIWLVAGWARRTFRRSTSEANLFFCVGIFAFTVTGIVGHIRTQNAARAAPYANDGSGTEASTSAKPTTKPAPTSQAVNPFKVQAMAARKQFLVADKYLREKSAAQTAVGLLEEGKPWRWIDTLVDTRSAEFKRGYQAWRAAEIAAGNDPRVSEQEFAAISKLHAIRMAIAKYRVKNARPPTARNIATLPANPITGQKALGLFGLATPSHGWSYDEQNGKIRIVLPEGNYGGLHKDEIERVKAKK